MANADCGADIFFINWLNINGGFFCIPTGEKNWGAWTLDFRPDFTAAESGLDVFINWDKEFIGKKLAQNEKKIGPKKKLVTMSIDTKDIDVTNDEAILKDNKCVGYITSGGYAHHVRKNNLESQFIGKNFVFDARLGERITDDIISNCHQCGETSDNHIDCNNDACHILFIQCSQCSEKYEQCCSIECMEFNKLSPDKQQILRKDPDQVVSKTRNSTSVKPRLN